MKKIFTRCLLANLSKSRSQSIMHELTINYFILLFIVHMVKGNLVTVSFRELHFRPLWLSLKGFDCLAHLKMLSLSVHIQVGRRQRMRKRMMKKRRPKCPLQISWPQVQKKRPCLL